MEEASAAKYGGARLAWAVLCNTPNGRSEIIKITDHDDADRTIQYNPEMFWKSGPFVLPY